MKLRQIPRKTLVLVSHILLGSILLNAHALLFGPIPEGFAFLKIVESSPDLILCELRVSGGPTTELIAIDPAGPAILWRVPSTEWVWRALSMDGDYVYTVEGTILQRRRKRDGAILARLDLAPLSTPASTRRPWTEFEQTLEHTRLLLASAQENDQKELEDRIEVLETDIEALKNEWGRIEARNNLLQDGSFSFNFFHDESGNLLVERIKRWGQAFDFHIIFREVLEFDPKTGELISAKEKTPAEYVQLRKRPRQNPYPHNLTVLDQFEFPKMEVESITQNIILLAQDSENHREIWHLVLPVEIKRVRE